MGGIFAVLGLLAVAVAAAGWQYSDHLESDNDFCTSCHLPDATPLHAQIREDFDRLIPVDLGGVHGRAFLDRHEHDPGFRCIDCHAGAGVLGRTGVKLLAAKDALRYAVGSFGEPDGMPWRLPAQLCLQCHARLRNAAAPGWSREAFHGIEGHATTPGLPCVDCHGVHGRGGDAFAYFLDRQQIRAQCRTCHPDFAASGEEFAR